MDAPRPQRNRVHIDVWVHHGQAQARPAASAGARLMPEETGRQPISPPRRPRTTACPILMTERLRMREWRDADVGPFAAMNADAVVMEYFPETYGSERTIRFVELIRKRWSELGYSLWAVERLDQGRFIGYVGLWPATFPAPFTPAVEVGWRLAADQWGQGYATEGGHAALQYAFATLGFDEIVSFTSVINVRSWRVMERLGMVRDVGGDFDHPAVPEGHPLRPHVLYRIRRASIETGYRVDQVSTA